MPVIFDLADTEFDWDEYDTIRFKEINMIGDTIYLKAERWGYQEGNGWKICRISEAVNKNRFFCERKQVIENVRDYSCINGFLALQ